MQKSEAATTIRQRYSRHRDREPSQAAAPVILPAKSPDEPRDKAGERPERQANQHLAHPEGAVVARIELHHEKRDRKAYDDAERDAAESTEQNPDHAHERLAGRSQGSA